MQQLRIMAEEKEVAVTPAAGAKGGKQLLLLVAAMVLTVLAAVGGALFWLTRSGRLPVGGAVQPVQAAARPEPPKTRMLLLEPLLVNLADAGGAGYLRVVLALRVEEPPPPAKGEKAKEEKPAEKGKVVVNEEDVRLRDAALTVLGRETSERLLQPEGKDRAREELKQAFRSHAPDTKVVDILFTEFLVQR